MLYELRTAEEWQDPYVAQEGDKIIIYTRPAQPSPFKRGNWRLVWFDGQWWTEIEDSADGYLWPDCSYNCKYCGACLGCLRKEVVLFNFKEGEKQFFSWNDDAIRCKIATNHLHSPIERD